MVVNRLVAYNYVNDYAPGDPSTRRFGTAYRMKLSSVKRGFPVIPVSSFVSLLPGGIATSFIIMLTRLLDLTTSELHPAISFHA